MILKQLLYYQCKFHGINIEISLQTKCENKFEKQTLRIKILLAGYCSFTAITAESNMPASGAPQFRV